MHARSCPGTAVHASGTIALASLSENYHCLSYLLWGIADSKKNTIESRQNTRKITSKQYMRQSIPLFRKVMISLLTDPGQIVCSAR